MMTTKREALSRWRYPNRNALDGEVFPSGRPPFAPFPSVTNLLLANLCPVAIYHDLIHGIGNALIGQYPLKKRGDLFHKFIAHLKLSLKNRSIKLSGHDTQAQINMIKSSFLEFSQKRGFSIDDSSDIWEKYIEPWAQRKLRSRELESISKDDQTFFELSVASSRVLFPLDKGVRYYPLKGRIDEIDLTRKRIIERTIKGIPSDMEPPLFKGYQVWLLWKILRSLKGDKLPLQWPSLNFTEFDLIVETPFNDFSVPKDNTDWVMGTHYAYAWINDISISESPGVVREVYENAACSYIAPHPKCAHKFLICFTRNYPYPKSRAEIKQVFKPWYRLHLWEQIWEGHLFQYQLLTLERSKLKELGLISDGKIISFKDDRLEMEIADRETGPIRGYKRYTIIPFGTLFCGKKMGANLVEIKKNHFIMEINDEELALSREAILLPYQSEPSPIMQEPPIYLKKQVQKALLRLQNSGVIKPESAKSKSLIQLLEGIFGRRPLRGGVKMKNIEEKIEELNDPQKDAVNSILEGWDGSDDEFNLPIVNGPPGTGKTTVGVRAAAKYVLEEGKAQVAYLCYTNYAAEKAREDFFELNSLSQEVIRLSSNPKERDWNKGIVGCNSFLTDLTENEKRRLRRARILISTLHGSGRIFQIHKRPKIIVDEFSQVSPPLYFSTLSKVRRTTEYNPSGYALLGDPNQLPVITSQPLLRPNVGVFIFARKDYQPHNLTLQYRMHQDICEIVNALRAALHTYRLKTDNSIRDKTLTHLGYTWNESNCPTNFHDILAPENTCVIINTDELPGEEETGFGKSTYYTGEAKLAARLANLLSQCYKSESGERLLPTILSPYSAQIGTIQSFLTNPNLQNQCLTVYKAQGREYPCVIISFTRKNPMGWIGFLKEPELRAQTYVACSRAMAKLFILLSFSTFLGRGHTDFEYMIGRCSNNALKIDADPEWCER